MMPDSGKYSKRLTRMNSRRSSEIEGLTYFFTLIDDAVSRIIKSEGGMLWAAKTMMEM